MLRKSWDRRTPEHWYLAQLTFWVYMVYYVLLAPEEGKKEKDPPIFKSADDLLITFVDRKPEKPKTPEEIKAEKEQERKERIDRSKMFWMGGFFDESGKLKTRTPPQEVDEKDFLEPREVPPHPATEQIDGRRRNDHRPNPRRRNPLQPKPRPGGEEV